MYFVLAGCGGTGCITFISYFVLSLTDGIELCCTMDCIVLYKKFFV